MKTGRNMSNLEIARLLRSVSAALLLLGEDENRFRVTAYEHAADSIEHASTELKDLWSKNELRSLPGVGETINSYLEELFKIGKVRHFQKILNNFPPALYELLEIPSIGPKSALKLCRALGISAAHSAISKLEKAARKGQIAKIEGFGEDSQSKILQGVVEFRSRSHRLLLSTAQNIADQIINWLQKSPDALEINALGSLRRQSPTVGDVDIAVATNNPKAVVAHFMAYPNKKRIVESGDRTASLILSNNVQIDLMTQPPSSYGSLLQHFTGSRQHNIILRELALKRGYSLSEYGIKNAHETKEFDNEKSFYNFIGLDWIPPELRENQGEIELARVHKIPKLVIIDDIKGDMHIHSSFDVETSHDLGKDSISQLATKAKSLGYEYLGLTEHNPAFTQHSQSDMIEIIKRKTRYVQEFSDFPIFNGLEIDIQPKGFRSVPDAAIELLDYACVSIHSSFRMTKKAMTSRIIAGLDHPKIKFLAHPTARLIQEREGIDADWDQIFDFCLKKNKWLEINSSPNRLDLPDTLVRDAIKYGLKIVINTDSHVSENLLFMKYGVSVARRGWATKNDIVNTSSLTNMRKLLLGGD